jgi:hypothetical protein
VDLWAASFHLRFIFFAAHHVTHFFFGWWSGYLNMTPSKL